LTKWSCDIPGNSIIHLDLKEPSFKVMNLSEDHSLICSNVIDKEEFLDVEKQNGVFESFKEEVKTLLISYT